MSAIRYNMRRLGANARGATAIEYGLIAALIAVAAMAAMSNMGGGSSGMWTRISDNFTDATT